MAKSIAVAGGPELAASIAAEAGTRARRRRGRALKDLLRSASREEAVQAILERGLPPPAEDPVVIEAAAGLHALRQRLRVAAQWDAWHVGARRALEQLSSPLPPELPLADDWARVAAGVQADARLLLGRLGAFQQSFRRGLPKDRNGGRPRQVSRNFAYTLDVLWERDRRPRLTPTILALEALAVDKWLDGGLWAEVVGRGTATGDPLRPWRDLLASVRREVPEPLSVETFTLVMAAP